jgi:hypothetical protein
MTLQSLIFDVNGPYGVSKDGWWALITTILFGGVIPFIWRRIWVALDERRWRPLRQHFGIMLSWNHGRLGQALSAAGKNTPDEQFIKIQNEIGFYISSIISDSKLVKSIGDYIDALEKLWWWLDWKNEPTAADIPEHWKQGDLRSKLDAVNTCFKRAIKRLHVEPSLVRLWQIGQDGVVRVVGDPLEDRK